MSQAVPIRLRSLARFALAMIALAVVSACTVTITSDSDRTGRDPFLERDDPIIQQFEPAAGEGSSYRIGSEISFRVRTRLDGYLTLTSLAPDGDVYTFARNVPVSGGRSTVIDGSDRGVVFLVDPPRGWHRVRASFTPRRTDTSRITFRGIAGEDDWRAAIRVDLEPFEERDVTETRFYVR